MTIKTYLNLLPIELFKIICDFCDFTDKISMFLIKPNELLKAFKNNQEIVIYWKKITKLTEIQQMLKYSKQTKLELSNDQLLDVLRRFESIHYYETNAYLVDNIKLNKKLVEDLIRKFLVFLTTPNNKTQQISQLEIIKKLTQYPTVKNRLKYFNCVIKSLNVQLIDFYIKEFKIDINELFRGLTALQLVVEYLIDNKSNNIEFAYEMFDYLLSIGADVKQINDQIPNNNIQITLLQKILSSYEKEKKIKRCKVDEDIKVLNECIELSKDCDFEICDLLLKKRFEILKYCIDNV